MSNLPDINVEKRHYTYLLKYPKKWVTSEGEDLSNVVFYVGKGVGRRALNHSVEAKTKCRCKKCAIIRTLWQAGSDFQIEIVFQSDSEEEALNQENQAIEEHASLHLVNIKGNSRSREMHKQVYREQVKQEAEAFLHEYYLKHPDEKETIQAYIANRKIK